MPGLRRYGSTLADIPFNVYNADGDFSRAADGNLGVFPANQITEWSTVGDPDTAGDDFVTTAADTGPAGLAAGQTIVVADVARASDGVVTVSTTDIVAGGTPVSGDRIATNAFGATGDTVSVFINGNSHSATIDGVAGDSQTLLRVSAATRGRLSNADRGMTISMVIAGTGDSFQGFAGTNWTLDRNAVTGTSGFNFTLANDQSQSPTTSRIHVLRDFNLNFTDTAGFGIDANGTHVCLVNSFAHFYNFDTHPQGRFLFRELEAGAGFSSGGSQDLGRPVIFDSNTNITQNRSVNFYGSDIVFGSADISAGGRANIAIGDCYDSTFRFLEETMSGSGTSIAVYPKAGAIWQNVYVQDINGRTGGVATIFATGPTTFIACDIRGFAFQIADVARVKTFGLVQAADGLVAGFNSGNVNSNARLQNIPYGLLGFLKQVNPTRVLPTTSNSGNIQFTSDGLSGPNGVDLPLEFRRSQRYIELQQWIPDYNETLTTKADGINIVADQTSSFIGPNNFVSYTASPRTDAYRTDANGGISGQVYIPDEGQVGTVVNSDGLQFPIGIYGTTATANDTTLVNDISFNTVNLDIRSFFHNFEATLTINKASLDARAAGANAGTAIVANPLTPINAFIRDAALYSSGTTKRTAVQLSVYIGGIVPATPQRLSAQDIYEVLVWQRTLASDAGYLDGFARPTVNSAGTVVWSGNLQLNAASNFVFTQSTNTYQLAGSGLEREDGDLVAGLQVTSLDANGGPILENVNSTITNVRTTATLPNENRGTDYDLQGVIDGVINLSVNSDVTLYVNITSNGLTINNTGTGTVTIRTNQVPAAGATTSIANVTAGTNVVFEATDAIVNVREPIIARFPDVPVDANWALLAFNNNNYGQNPVRSLTGETRPANVLATSIDNDTAARNGTTLNFRSPFPATSGADEQIPATSADGVIGQDNAAYNGLELAILDPEAQGNVTRLMLVVADTNLTSSLTWMDVTQTIATRTNVSAPAPEVTEQAIGSSAIPANVSALPTGRMGAFVTVSTRVPQFNIFGYSPLILTEGRANPLVSNAVMAAARGDVTYVAGLWNVLGIQENSAATYPATVIPTSGRGTLEFDIINTPTPNQVNLRQGRYLLAGTNNSNSDFQQLQQLQSVYEVLNNDALGPLPVEGDDLTNQLTVDNISVRAIAENSVPIDTRVGDDDVETPSVISDERALTLDAVVSEAQIRNIVQTDGNRTRRNIPPPS